MRKEVQEYECQQSLSLGDQKVKGGLANRSQREQSVKEAKGENVLKEVERPRYIQTTEKCKKLGKRTQCDLSTNHDNFTENSYTRVAGWKKTAIRAQQCASSVIRLNTERVTQC